MATDDGPEPKAGDEEEEEDRGRDDDEDEDEKEEVADPPVPNPNPPNPLEPAADEAATTDKGLATWSAAGMDLAVRLTPAKGFVFWAPVSSAGFVVAFGDTPESRLTPANGLDLVAALAPTKADNAFPAGFAAAAPFPPKTPLRAVDVDGCGAGAALPGLFARRIIFLLASTSAGAR